MASTSIAMRTQFSIHAGTVTRPRRNVATDGSATPAIATGQTRDSIAMIDRRSCLSFATCPKRTSVAQLNARLSSRPELAADEGEERADRQHRPMPVQVLG